MSNIQPRILHCLPDSGNAPDLAGRLVRLSFAASHEVMFAAGNSADARNALRNTRLAMAQDTPEISGGASPGKLNALAQSLTKYDLVLTYGWETINVALAHRVFGQHLGLPALIHHEFDFAEAAEITLKRKFLRRIALGSTAMLVTQSPAVGQFAQNNWGMPPAKILQILPDVEVKRFRPSAKPEALPGLVKRSHEIWIGAFCTPSNLASTRNLIQALAELPAAWQLVVRADHGLIEELGRIAAQAELSHRVHLLDLTYEEPVVLALCDLFVDLAGQYSPPISAMKAMAAANAVVTSQDGAAAGIATKGTGNVLADSHGQGHLEKALLSFSGNPDALARIGKANRDIAMAEFGHGAGADRLSALYRFQLSH